MVENRALSLSNNDDFDAMDQRDRIMPRLKIMQGLSKEVQEGLFKSGQLIDTTGKRLICDIGKQVKATHLFFWKEWIEFNPLQGCPKNEIILNRSTDPNSDLSKLAGNFHANKIQTKKGEKMRVTEIYNFVATIPEVTENWEECFIFSYMKTGHKVGKQLLNRMAVLKQRDPATGESVKARIWAYEWMMGAKTDKNSEGQEYYVPFIGECTVHPEANWGFLLEMSNALKSKRATVEAMATEQTVSDVAGAAAETQANVDRAEM